METNPSLIEKFKQIESNNNEIEQGSDSDSDLTLMNAYLQHEMNNGVEIIDNPSIESEQQALIKYLENPIIYLNHSYKFLFESMLLKVDSSIDYRELSFTECFDILFPTAYPNGSKISKIKEDGVRYLQIGVTNISREYLLDSLITDSSIQIPFKKLFSIDSGQLSCTIAKQKVFFHESWAELSSVSPFYFKKESSRADCYHTVKPLVDKVGNKFCIISKTYRDIDELPRDNQLVLDQTGLYFSSTMFRFQKFNIKKIEIMPYQGPSLSDYLENNPDIDEKDLLSIALKVLESFKAQLIDKSIIHTDIKFENICIMKNDHQFQVVFIDFEEAYLEGEQPHGLGTAGYTPPECFKKADNHLIQLSIREKGQEAWLKCLKPNFKDLFTYESDCYAIGCVLNELLRGTKYYLQLKFIINQFKNEEPSSRPKKEDISRIIEYFSNELSLDDVPSKLKSMQI